MTDEPVDPDGDKPPEDPHKPPNDGGPTPETPKPSKRPDSRPLRRTKHKPKRTVAQREQDLAAIAKLFLQNQTYNEISHALGISVQMIVDDVGELVKRWRESGIRDFESNKAIILQEIANVQNEAWKAFFKSQKIKKTTTRKIDGNDSPFSNDGMKPGKSSSRKMAQIAEIESAGDPRFMMIVRDCQKQICTLLGLDAQQTIPKTEPDTLSKYVAAAREMSTDELESLQRMEQKFIALEKKDAVAS